MAEDETQSLLSGSDDDSPEFSRLFGGSAEPSTSTTTLQYGVSKRSAGGSEKKGSSGSQNPLETNRKLSLVTKLAFGFPNLGTAAMTLPTQIHINKFFADTLMVPPGTLAVATAIARAFDTLLDPFWGWISDSTHTRWGRRKPYIAIGAPLNAIFYFFLFTPPVALSANAAAVWFTVFFAVYLMAPMSLPHHALGPELTSDYEERSSLYAWSEVFALTGVIAAAAAPGLLAQVISNPRTVFFYMALTIAVLVIGSFALLLMFVEEPVQVVKDTNPLIPGLRRAWRNRPFRVLVITSMIGSIAHHCSSLMFPFYISYVLHPENDALWLSACLLVYFGCSAISVPMWCKLAQHWDKRSVWLLGWAVHLPSSFCMFFLTEGATFSLIGLTCCTGLSFGGSSYLYKTIQADAIDYDELRTTRRREGQYITFWALVPKLVAIPASSIPLVVMQASGYIPNMHPQSQPTVLTIRILTTLIPCVLSALALAIAFTYPIDKRTNQIIQRMIVERRKAILAVTEMPRQIDPITKAELPQVDGGITGLKSEFCWYLDNFSEKELWLVLKKGRNGLIVNIWGQIAIAFCIFVVALVACLLGDTALQVMAVMTMSCGLAIMLFHAIRLNAARKFTPEKIREFRKSHLEYFRVMTDNDGDVGNSTPRPNMSFA